MSQVIELKLTEKVSGKGNILYVVVKKDADNYRGLYWANSESDMKGILIEENCEDMSDPDDLRYATEYIDQEFGYYQIGVMIPCISK